MIRTLALHGEHATMEHRMQSSNTRRMLERAAGLYERYGSAESEDFNIFSVLRAESDEVNLHSRFLAALLRQRRSRGASLRNLEDFLQSVVDIDDFRLDGVEVERERHGIDILVFNDFSRQAVVVENKIRAPDQPRQLARYAESMENEGYREPRLLYLTLDGSDPDEGSADGRAVTSVSYRKVIPWLERCQERAYDNPALRESVAQYIHLIRKLTGTDLKGAYMTALKDLILENNNLVLVHDLSEAMFEAKVSLFTRFWMEIDTAVRECIHDLPEKTKDSVSEKDIRMFLRRQRGEHYHGLYYSFGDGASLAIEVGRYMYFGVCCYKPERKKEYGRLKDMLQELDGNAGPDDWGPWSQWDPREVNYKSPERSHLEMLVDDEARAEYVDEIVGSLSMVWDKVRDYAVGGAQGS